MGHWEGVPMRIGVGSGDRIEGEAVEEGRDVHLGSALFLGLPGARTGPWVGRRRRVEEAISNG